MRIDTEVKTVRDNWGQFATQMDAATADAMRDVASEGARAAQGFAPPALAGTFEYWASGRLAWAWGSGHQWAEGLNSGIPEHMIGRPGQFLTNEHRSKRPGEAPFAARGPVRHPGVTGSHFMERSFAAVEPDIMPSLRDEVARHVRGY